MKPSKRDSPVQIALLINHHPLAPQIECAHALANLRMGYKQVRSFDAHISQNIVHTQLERFFIPETSLLSRRRDQDFHKVSRFHLGVLSLMD